MQQQAAQLLAEKLTRELYRIAQAYGKKHPFRFEDLTHDLAVMLRHNALRHLSLKFFRPGEQRAVLVAYDYALHAGRPTFHLDDAQGLGIVPLAPPFDMRLVVNRDPQNGRYQRQLRLNWGDAPQFAQRDGFTHQDGNTTKRTGGRASKQVYMDAALRQQGRVKFFLPHKQYGFIAGNGVDVFFHQKNVQGFTPRPGQAISYLPLVTPRGIQAKDVRPA
jgi:cold shock CspA family protein